jgi:hypothetical protein
MGFRKVVPQVIQKSIIESIVKTMANSNEPGDSRYFHINEQGDLIVQDYDDAFPGGTEFSTYKIMMVVVNNG